MLYGTQNPPAALLPGDWKYLFGTSSVVATGPTPGVIQAPNDANVQYEDITVPMASAAAVARSIAAQLCPVPGRPPGAMIQLVWPADPGVFTCQVQESARDEDGLYLLNAASAAYTINAATAVGDGRYTAWTELQPQGGGFIRLKFTALAGSKLVSAKLVYV